MIINFFKVKRVDSNKFDKKMELKCDKCGKLFEMFDSSFKLGQKRHIGKHLCFMCSNAREYKKIITGKDNKKFKGGISPSGYRRIYYNGKNQSEHRIVAEKLVNRKLNRNDYVHHINGIKLDNSPDNLFVFSGNSSHIECHNEAEKLVLSLLSKYIWFNQKLKEYVCVSCENYSCQKTYGKTVSKEDDRFKEQIKTNPSKRYTCKYGTNRGAHIFIVEYIIGRKLFRDEVVHHINGNINDNSPDNLFLSTRRDHKKIHGSIWRCCSDLFLKKIISFKDGKYFLNKKE